jgi:Uma2 family endonuclease
MTEALAALDEVRRPMKVSEYVAIAKLGVFDGERVELLRGQVVRMAPMGNEHASVVETLNQLLVETFGRRARVRPGLPMEASEDSMPEPDFAVIAPRTGINPHPTQALLLIEVSHSSLRIDREVKAPLYAETGSPEYWIIDIEHAALEVYRAPKNGQWTEQFTLTARDSIRPVSFPDVELSLASVLLALTH